MFAIRRTMCAMGLSVAAAAVSAEPVTITYPQLADNDRRYDYPMELLELALAKANVDYTLEPKPEPASHQRMATLMKEKGDWTVGFFGADPFYEENLRPIHFPLYRGLLGNRIAIIHRDNADLFNEIDTYEEFMALSICQGLGWGDTNILEAAGFNMVKSNYENLFKMTQAKRCDAYTRAVFEPYAEVEGHAAALPDLMVDDSILIRYRLAFLMYIDPSQEKLAQAIETGLNIAMEDGSFQALFEAAPTIAEAKAKVNDSARTCIEIDNPFMSEAIRAIPDEYWGGFVFGSSADGTAGCQLIRS